MTALLIVFGIFYVVVLPFALVFSTTEPKREFDAGRPFPWLRAARGFVWPGWAAAIAFRAVRSFVREDRRRRRALPAEEPRKTGVYR